MPSPLIMRAVTLRTNSGASAETDGFIRVLDVAWEGTLTSWYPRALSTDAMFMATIASPFLP